MSDTECNVPGHRKRKIERSLQERHERLLDLVYQCEIVVSSVIPCICIVKRTILTFQKRILVRFAFVQVAHEHQHLHQLALLQQAHRLVLENLSLGARHLPDIDALTPAGCFRLISLTIVTSFEETNPIDRPEADVSTDPARDERIDQLSSSGQDRRIERDGILTTPISFLHLLPELFLPGGRGL